MWWPGNWPSGRKDDQIAMIFDLYPTILGALGERPLEDLDGVDLFAEERSPRALRWYSHGLFGEYYGMLSPDGQWRLSYWKDVAEQLFHENDFVLTEPASRAEEQPQQVRQMHDSMEQWIR